jgi:hypothetical protein
VAGAAPSGVKNCSSFPAAPASPSPAAQGGTRTTGQPPFGPTEGAQASAVRVWADAAPKQHAVSATRTRATARRPRTARLELICEELSESVGSARGGAVLTCS